MNIRIRFRSTAWLITVLVFALGWAATARTSAAQPTAVRQLAALNLKIEKIDDHAFPKMKVNLSVSDAQGFPIKNLTSEDFTVSEQGKLVSPVSAASFLNTEQPLAVALVIDTSGSMQDKPLINSVAAAKAFIKSLAPADHAGLVSFASKVAPTQGLSTDRKALNTQLDALKASGNTALYDALIEGIGLVKNRAERRVVLLLTDGNDSGISKFTFNEVVNEAVRWSTPIYPIGFGSVDQTELAKLAQLTGGAAQINPDSSTLNTAFNTVLGMLREQYQLQFTSTLSADGLEHPLEVGVKYQNGFVSASRSFTARPGQVTVKIVEPLPGQALGGKFRIRIDVLAPVAVRQVDLQIDGQPLTSLQNPPYEYLWDSTMVQPGNHMLNASAVDQAGNRSKAQAILEIRTPVKIKLSLTPDQALSRTASLPVQVDTLSGLARIDYFIDDKPVGTITTAPYELAWDTTKVSPGYHIIRVQAVDVNGFKGEDSQRVNVILQNNFNLLAVALIVMAAAVAFIVPLSVGKRRALLAANATGAAAASSPSGLAATSDRAGARESAAAADLAAEAHLSVMATPVATGGTAATLSTPVPAPPRLATPAGQPMLIERTGVSPGQVWPLGSAEIRLGRKRDENDIPLRGLSASRHHALICQQGSVYVIYALNPQNPLIINGNAVHDQAVLCRGDTIQAGESTFHFEVKSAS